MTRTTIGGILIAIGTGLNEAPYHWAQTAGPVLMALGALLLGHSAADSRRQGKRTRRLD